MVVAACSRGPLVKARWRGGEWMAMELGYAVMTDKIGFTGEGEEWISAEWAQLWVVAGLARCGVHGRRRGWVYAAHRS